MSGAQLLQRRHLLLRLRAVLKALRQILRACLLPLVTMQTAATIAHQAYVVFRHRAAFFPVLACACCINAAMRRMLRCCVATVLVSPKPMPHCRSHWSSRDLPHQLRLRLRRQSNRQRYKQRMQRLLRLQKHGARLLPIVSRRFCAMPATTFTKTRCAC